MQLQADCQALPEGYQIEGYRIDRVLSRGGFSIAYMASAKDGTPIVVKEYLPMHLAKRAPEDHSLYISPEGLGKFNSGMRSFLEEARLLAHIRHPNIVAVLDFTKANNTAYIMMKFEQGHSLEEYIFRLHERGKTIRENFLRDVFVRLLSGLREVHSRKLLHLDLKPANIYLCKDGRPLLLDFGAARWGLGQSEGVPGNVHTRGFASPEQHGCGESLGPWTDIYAIGATLYSCLDSGKTPQSADLRIAKDEVEPAQRRWAKAYSRQLLELIDWCMQLPAGSRPQSVYALQKVLNGELLDLVDPRWFPK